MQWHSWNNSSGCGGVDFEYHPVVSDNLQLLLLPLFSSVQKVEAVVINRENVHIQIRMYLIVDLSTLKLEWRRYFADFQLQ